MFAGAVLVVLTQVHAVIQPLSLETWSEGLPLWSRVAMALMLGDLLTYWFHRACHHYEFLWRFHAVHHSAERLDWLAAHREHPLFANLAPYLDLLFGTYHRPCEPETYPLGLTDPWPRRYLAQLIRPFRGR